MPDTKARVIPAGALTRRFPVLELVVHGRTKADRALRLRIAIPGARHPRYLDAAAARWELTRLRRAIAAAAFRGEPVVRWTHSIFRTRAQAAHHYALPLDLAQQLAERLEQDYLPALEEAQRA
jgi:hypothetical protein